MVSSNGYGKIVKTGLGYAVSIGNKQAAGYSNWAMAEAMGSVISDERPWLEAGQQQRVDVAGRSSWDMNSRE